MSAGLTVLRVWAGIAACLAFISAYLCTDSQKDERFRAQVIGLLYMIVAVTALK